MEIQTIAEFETSPKGIVEQLLDIAEKYDCMSEIGNATSWRWKEGIITRMPKIKTVAKILRAAYNTEDPHVWYRESSGDLRKFIKNAFDICYSNISYFEPQNIYEAVCYLSLSDGKGVTVDELATRLSILKFAKNLDEDDDFQEFDPKLIMELHFDWAEKLAQSFIDNFNVPSKNGYYSLGDWTTNSSERLIYFINEINAFQQKIMRNCSHFDMWSFFHVSLTDAEMIELELAMIQAYKDIMARSNKITSFEGRNNKSMRTRLFTFSAISLNNQPKEELTWQN